MVFSAIPQVITEDRASGAQVVEGSLKFDSGKSTHLQRTQVGGNRKTFTWSAWIKKGQYNAGASDSHDWFSASEGDTTAGVDYGFGVRFPYYTGHSTHSDQLMVFEYENSAFKMRLISEQVFRDYGGFYHIVIAVDTTIASPASDRVKVYINGERITAWKSGYETYPSQNLELTVSESGKTSQIGCSVENGTGIVQPADGWASNFYLIDGQALGPENFGYTDPLTNTWRPKKYEGDFKIIPDNQLLYNVNTGDNGFDSGTSSRTYDATGRTFTTYTTPQTANPGGFGANSAHVYKSPDGAAIDWVISTDTTDRYIWTSTDGVNWTNTGVQDTDGSPQTVNTAWLAMAGGSNASNVTVTSSTAGYGLVTGQNSFYLPMDGNSPIGKDQSGNGNDWEPVRFGGSVELPKATGAIPVLNTNEAGTVAKKGVRTDKKTYTVTASGGNYYIDGALKPTLNAYRGGSYTFDYTGATSHPFYLSSLPDGKHNSKAYSVHLDGTGDEFTVTASGDLDFGANDDWTMECFFWTTTIGGGWAISDYEGNASATGSPGGQIYFSSSTGLHWYQNSTRYAEIPRDSIKANRWYHLAFVKDGTSNTIKSYLDGVQQASSSFNGSSGSTSNGLIIGQQGGGTHFNGYISNFRVVKGQQVYTDNFTPSTTPLTSTSQGVTGSNCKLLAFTTNNLTTPEVGPSITASGDPIAVNSHSPFLYNDVHGNFGVNTATSNTTKITIPHLAADTLYYYCQNHSGMGSSINVTTDIFKADPYAWKCMFAMASDTVDHSPEINVNSTASIFSDIHTSNLQRLRNLYGHSKKMETGGGFRIDMELTTAEANAKHQWGTNDFTVECWHYQDGGQTSWQSLFRSGSYNNNGLGSDGISHYANGQTLFPYWAGAGGSGQFGQTGNVVPYKKWNHTAWTRQGGVNRIFANGILIKTFNNSNSWDNKGFEIGDVYTWNGGYQDARIYNGVAKYTESFVVPATEPDVLPDSPSGITGKTNLTKITEGAISFDGSGDYLTIPWSTDFELGTGDFTIEYYGYWNSSGTSIAWGADLSNRFDLGSLSTGSVRFFCRSNSSTFIDISADITLHKWIHIAAVREGTAFRLYVDGKLEASGTASDTMPNDSSNTLDIGRRRYASTAAQPTDGFISNVRILKGTALYTSDFTPPTEPLTNVTNTVLLCCQSNTSAIDTAVLPGTAPNTSNWSARSNWNSGGTLTNASSYPLTAAFDGNLNTTFAMSYAGGMIWTAPATISFATGIEVYVNSSHGVGQQGYITTISGSQQSKVDVNADANWQTIYSGSGTFDKLEITRADSSGNNNLWITAIRVDGVVLADPIAAYGNAAATNFNPFTDDINAIRGQASGYATLNPLNVTGTLSDGNLSFYRVAKGGTTSTIGVESGKIYVEAKGDVGSGGFGFGFVQSNYTNDGLTDIGDATNSFGIRAVYNNVTFKIQGATNTGINIDSTIDTIFAYAVDFDTGLVNLLRDGVIIHSQTLSLASGTYYVAVASETASATKNIHVNFGQKPFKFPPPDGYQPLNLSNVQPEKVIARPDQYVAATLFTGTGDAVSSRTVELPHAADLVWAKSRDRASSNQLLDTVRGDNLVLQTNATMNDRNPITQYSGGGLSTIDGRTLTIASGTTNNQNLNTLNEKGVIWSWKAGGNKNTFNIDDVGYANASDVNMNAGALNSSFYNDSEVWTTTGTLTVDLNGSAVTNINNPLSNVFEGSLASSSMCTEGTAYSSGTKTYTYTFGTAQTNITSARVYLYQGNSAEGGAAGFGNGTVNKTQDGTYGWVDATSTIPSNGTVTAMTMTTTATSGVNSARNGFIAVELNGKILLDNGVTPTDNFPSITPTGCSVGTKQGFSILMYQGNGTAGSSIVHGLSEAPKLMIHKSIDQSRNWYTIYNDGTSQMKYLYMNTTDIANNSAVVAPTSTLMNFTSSAESNNSGENYIVYMWHDVPGLQKFGTYEGNTTEGAFVELGFRPAIIMLKSFDQTWYWNIQDSKRSPINPSLGNFLVPNENYVEGTASVNNNIDFLSNGFKIRSTTSSSEPTNVDGQTYFYAAWAEAPTVNLYGGHANAR